MEAGRGSWTNAGDCSLNASSCESTMSSLRPTEPGRNPKHKVHFPMRLPCGANTSALYFPETSHYVTPPLYTPSLMRPHPLSKQWPHPKGEQEVILIEARSCLVKLSKHMQSGSMSHVTKIELTKYQK